MSENPRWLDDTVQFPRLLAEISACVAISASDFEALAASMDLTVDEVNELFDRAQEAWERSKAFPDELTAVEDEDEDDAACTGTGRRVVEEIGRGTRTVTGTLVRVTELVWDDGGRSFEVHRQDDGADLTTDQCFDELPTDAQIAALLTEES